MDILPKITPLKRLPHIFEPNSSYRDTKDPVVVQDETTGLWHMYGSGGTSITETWEILHAISKNIDGPWELQSPVQLVGITPTVRTCAPGIIKDADGFHMFVQTECMGPNGKIYYLKSTDGSTFIYRSVALESLRNTRQAAMYDAHPALVLNANGKKEYYMTYSGGPDTGSPVKGDVYLAKSITSSWDGPWQRMGPILSHHEVPHHNQYDHQDYEWGLEGAQLIQLKPNKFLLNAVSFLPQGQRGTRQRVFFALADKITGPYKTLGPVLDPLPHPAESGENGHAAGFVKDGKLHLFYQSRPFDSDSKWRYGLATFDHTIFENVV